MKSVEDTWLTDKLHREVYRFTLDDASVEKDGHHIQHINEFIHRNFPNKPMFIYTKVAPTATKSIKWLGKMGFNLIDTNVIFTKLTSPNSHLIGHSQVRFATSEDEHQTVEVARHNFIFSRFHLDPAFTKNEANMVKAEWVRNYFCGKRGQQMVVAAIDNQIVGFNQILYGANQTLIIDLIAVDNSQRRKAIASDMIAYAEIHCPNFTTICVGTQLANIPSIRLYEKMGFRMSDANYVFHYHG